MDSQDFFEKKGVVRALATLVLLNSLLIVPLWIRSGRPGPHYFALESGIVLGLFLLLPARRWSRALAWSTSIAAVSLSLLVLADTTARLSLARPLNLYLDVRLVSAVSNLLRGALGTVGGVAVMAGVSALAVACAVALARLLEGQLEAAPSRRRRVVGACVLGLSLVAIPGRWLHPGGVVLALPTVQLVREQTEQMARMLQERDLFSAEMAAAPSSYAGRPGLLSGLGGRDVVLAFIESYGMSALDDERYAPVVRPRLEAMEDAVEAAGLSLATGALVAPSQGGMSWLGHGSMLSGLWLENQLRYDLLLASDRRSLVDDFEAAGYRTVAVMPAITLAWPEGERFGYDRIYAHRDIDYAGPPLNWVTMPDQFTWSFMERRVRGETTRPPVFVELGLISSHAPWTPILEVLDDWDGIGDGAVFERWRDAGEAPEELWRDVERVRDHYALAVGYAVDVLGSYAARYVDEGTILIALGDHQPAPLITGDEASRAVPVHVFATRPELLQPFLSWGFVPGALPPETEARRMDAFRDWFVTAYSEPVDGPREGPDSTRTATK